MVLEGPEALVVQGVLLHLEDPFLLQAQALQFHQACLVVLANLVFLLQVLLVDQEVPVFLGVLAVHSPEDLEAQGVPLAQEAQLDLVLPGEFPLHHWGLSDL